MTVLARGTFLTVKRSARKGKLDKAFHFPLTERTASLLLRDHSYYVGQISQTIKVPETTMEVEELSGGKYQATIFQDDLTGDGSSLADFLKIEEDRGRQMEAYGKALQGMMAVYSHSKKLESEGVKLGLESNPNNWWMKSNGDAVFFDTTPPLVLRQDKVNTDVLVPKENPTFFGRLSAWLARAPVISLLAEKVIRSYAFDWPTTVRTFLIKTIDCVPKIKDDLIAATREAIDKMPIDEKEGFQKKLSTFSIRLELFKLAIFKMLNPENADGLGGPREDT